ncbi:MAG: hypothetical protein B7X31_10025 [Thiomonas sp. 13-66-29]|nr:MAG: hypothetical protein B7X31_10025 [Thiomonas sp. 13-66-29]
MNDELQGRRRARNMVQAGGLPCEAVHKAALTRRRWLAGIGLMIAAAAYVMAAVAALHDRDVGVILGILGTVPLVFALVVASNSWLNEDDYYTVAGSRYADGGHRCIHCGGRGIWNKGEYGSNTVYARCSRCKADLFRN